MNAEKMEGLVRECMAGCQVIADLQRDGKRKLERKACYNAGVQIMAEEMIGTLKLAEPEEETDREALIRILQGAPKDVTEEALANGKNTAITLNADGATVTFIFTEDGGLLGSRIAVQRAENAEKS